MYYVSNSGKNDKSKVCIYEIEDINPETDSNWFT